jgi:hypothetical protein
MTKEQIVGVFQNLERGALHPFVRRLIPSFLDCQIQYACFCTRENERAGT